MGAKPEYILRNMDESADVLVVVSRLDTEMVADVDEVVVGSINAPVTISK